MGVFQLDAPYRYIKLVAWGGGSFTEPEIDAVAAVVPRRVAIDIKPGSYPNSINRNNNGVIPVALLGSSFFDVFTVDTSTLIFEGAKPIHVAYEDVNSDGFMDIIAQFRTQQTTLVTTSIQGCLTGKTTIGADFRGCDSVRIVGG